MPTYNYSCRDCGYLTTISQKITEPALSSCPSCKQETFQRGIGGGSATFRFLGEGFYINDYKKECTPSSNCCPCKENSS